MRHTFMGKAFSLLLAWIAIGLVGLSDPANSQMSSTNYRITTDVLAGGGGASGSTGYSLLSTLGQPTPSGASGSTGFYNYGGFIYTCRWEDCRSPAWPIMTATEPRTWPPFTPLRPILHGPSRQHGPVRLGRGGLLPPHLGL